MTTHGGVGTLQSPIYHEGLVDQQGETRLEIRPFTFHTDAGLVAGAEFSIQFTLEGSRSEVWPHFKDWNGWMNSFGYFWDGSPMDQYRSENLDLGTDLYHLMVRFEGEPELTAGPYVTLRVIPEHLFVQFQPILEDGPHGGVSNGFHVFMLNEQDGKTLITANIEHVTRTTGRDEDEVVEEWRTEATRWIGFWRDIFIPNLKNLVRESSS